MFARMGKILKRIAKKGIADGEIRRRYIANREDCLKSRLPDSERIFYSWFRKLSRPMDLSFTSLI
jgi:hypothetical protein